MKNILIASIAFILILSSCRKKLDISIPKGKEHIVINGIVTNDSLIKINISKSQDILNNDTITSLNNATVKLYNGETFIENLTNYGYGNYISTISSEIGKQYNISVSSGELKPVKAKMKLITPTQIVSIDTTIEVENNDFGEGFSPKQYNMHFKIKINDDANSKNYYMLSISSTNAIYDYEQYPPVIIGYYDINQDFDTNDIIFNGADSWFGIDEIYGRAFTDELINGKEYTINVNSHLYFDYYEEGIDAENYQIKVKLLSISEDIYKYIISYNLNQETEYDPFAQPVQIYTNIEDGLGLFSGYTMVVDSLSIDFLNK